MSHEIDHRPHAPGELRPTASQMKALEAASAVPRCGARTRSGTLCKGPAVSGRPRCRMHGCAPGAGGPRGMRNGNYRHGGCTKEAKAARRSARLLLRQMRTVMDARG